MLWRVTDAGRPGVSYLFGTMHLREEVAYTHLAKAQFAIRNTAFLATEFDLGDAQPEAMHRALQLPEGRSLSDLLTASWMKRLEKRLKKMGAEALLSQGQMSPLFFTQCITEHLFDSDHPQPLDAALRDYALAEGKRVGGIETFEEQIDILKAIPLEYQVKSLKEALSNLSAYRKHLRKTAKWYRDAELDQLYQAARKSIKGIRRLMLTQRNMTMADRILEMTKAQTCTFAVGAGHLMGKKGLIALLKARGLQVKPA